MQTTDYLEKSSEAHQQAQRFMLAAKSHDDYIAKSTKYNEYYEGEQWTAEDLAKLKEEGRPALTLNMVLSTVNAVLGEQSSRRADFQFKPRRSGTKEGAFAITSLVQAVADQNQFDWLESEMFSDGIIMDRGYMDIRMDMSAGDGAGDITMSTVHPHYVVPDPQANRYDPADWSECWTARWLSLDDIENDYEYGAKAVKTLKLQNAGDGLLQGHAKFEQASSTFGGKDGDSGMESLEGADIKQAQVIERQFYKRVTVHTLVDPASGQRRELPQTVGREKAQKLAEVGGLQLEATSERRVYWRTTVDQFVLHEGWSPYRTFTIIPYFPYFRHGKPMGLVKNLISPQEQYNKLSSQELHIVNSNANGGWIVEEGTLNGMTHEDLGRDGSKTGAVIKVNSGRAAGLQKIQPNQIPTGISKMKADAMDSIRQVSAISEGFLGLDQSEVSGVALKSQESRGQVQLQKPFDNLKRSRFFVARKLMELIQDFYTDERVVQFVDMEEIMPQDQNKEMVINQPDGQGGILNDVVNGLYDVAIGSMPSQDTMDDAQFAQVLNLKQAGIPIPGYAAIQYSQLTRKAQLAEQVKQLEGLGEPDPQQQEIQMKQLMLELAEKEATIRKLQADAGLADAKAANESEETERLLLQLESEQIINAQDHENRLRSESLKGEQALDQKVAQTRLDVLKDKATTTPTGGTHE